MIITLLYGFWAEAQGIPIHSRGRPRANEVFSNTEDVSNIKIVKTYNYWHLIEATDNKTGKTIRGFINIKKWRALMGDAANEAAEDGEERSITVTSSNGANFRTKPNSGSHRLATFPKGMVVSATGKRRNGYIQVEYKGYTGWVIDDAVTEGGFCPYGDKRCSRGIQKDRAKQEDYAEAALKSTTTGQKCTDKLLKTAREVANNWGEVSARKFADKKGVPWSKFRGKCGYAVRTALEFAGFYKGGGRSNSAGGLGHAKDTGPNLESLVGLDNIFYPGMRPEDAPVGAVLVYDKAAVSGCKGLGSTYGHIEIKDFGNRWIYDGIASEDIQKKFGKNCRPLKGVYVVGSRTRCGA